MCFNLELVVVIYLKISQDFSFIPGILFRGFEDRSSIYKAQSMYLTNSVGVLFQTINPLIARKMQDDKGRDYNNARRVSKEYEVVTKGLNRNTPSVPPNNSPDELKQVGDLPSGACQGRPWYSGSTRLLVNRSSD